MSITYPFKSPNNDDDYGEPMIVVKKAQSCERHAPHCVYAAIIARGSSDPRCDGLATQLCQTRCEMAYDWRLREYLDDLSGMN